MSHAEPSPKVRFSMNVFLDESAILLENLNAIVHAVANVEQAVVGKLRAVYRVAELLGGGSVRIVRAEVGVVGLVAVSSPVAFVLAGVGVEDDDAMIAVAVRDVQLVRGRIDKGLGRPAQVLDVVAALAVERLADLHQELAVLRKLQDLVVGIRRGGRGGSLILRCVCGGLRADGHCRRSRRCPCSRR